MTVVLGAGGQVGSAFRRLLGDGAIFLTRTELDLAHPERIAGVLAPLAPDVVVNCAAYTAVDRAEEEEDLATTINGVAVGVLAEWTAARAIPFVTYSTDYVFAGDATEPYLEGDAPDPVNAYGRSKRAGEELALRAHPRCLIVRTSWVVSGSHPNFIATILRRAREGSLRVVDDQYGCPTVAADLAAGTRQALAAGASGVLHLTNQGATTWHGLARAAVELAGLDPDLVTACPSSDFPTRAVRPSYSVLGSERLEPLGVEPLPAWERSLPGVVEEMLAWL